MEGGKLGHVPGSGIMIQKEFKTLVLILVSLRAASYGVGGEEARPFSGWQSKGDPWAGRYCSDHSSTDNKIKRAVDLLGANTVRGTLDFLAIRTVPTLGPHLSLTHLILPCRRDKQADEQFRSRIFTCTGGGWQSWPLGGNPSHSTQVVPWPALPETRRRH